MRPRPSCARWPTHSPAPTCSSASRSRTPSTRRWSRAMAKRPIIFAMANPDPEITPEDVYAVRKDAIVATGRSDYPNQINNVLGFPYIFRGALDVRASTINDQMKIAAAHALAKLAREDVPDEVEAAYAGRAPALRAPTTSSPCPSTRASIVAVPTAVAQAAMESGVARRPIIDLEGYKRELAGRLDPLAVEPAVHLRGGARAAAARRLRRGRGGERRSAPPLPSTTPASARPCWSAARSACARRSHSSGLGRPTARDHQRAPFHQQQATTPRSSTRGCSAGACSTATASAW